MSAVCFLCLRSVPAAFARGLFLPPLMKGDPYDRLDR